MGAGERPAWGAGRSTISPRPLEPTQPWSITGAPVSLGATPVWPVRLRHGGVGPPHIRCSNQSVPAAVRRGRLRARTVATRALKPQFASDLLAVEAGPLKLAKQHPGVLGAQFRAPMVGDCD